MQTSTMIKATARSAPDREREINNLIRKADFNNDPFVQEFGLNISHNLMEVSKYEEKEEEKKSFLLPARFKALKYYIGSI